jgi:nucleotide-binding universal stress UspA family protein
MGEADQAAEKHDDRVFLVVVDDTEEMKLALRFACRRAAHTKGRVALLYVVENSEFQHWMSVGDLMREEARSEGEQILQRCAAEVSEQTGSLPVLYLREGSRRSQLMELIDEEPSISILVLAADTGPRGPDRQVHRQAARADHHRSGQPERGGGRQDRLTGRTAPRPAAALLTRRLGRTT